MAYKYPYENEEKEIPRELLKTNRSMWKFMIFNLLTLGIYSIVFFIPFSFELEKIHPTGSKQMNFLGAYVLAKFTFSIVIHIWMYQMTKRVENALEYRLIDYEFGTGDFWLWFVFGSFFLVGPFVYYHKLCKAMNLLCENYNEKPII